MGGEECGDAGEGDVWGAGVLQLLVDSLEHQLLFSAVGVGAGLLRGRDADLLVEHTVELLHDIVRVLEYSMLVPARPFGEVAVDWVLVLFLLVAIVLNLVPVLLAIENLLLAGGF